MTYSFNFAISATISPATVKEMIKSVVEQQTGRPVQSVEFKVNSVLRGTFRDEHSVTEFDGAVVHFKNTSDTE